MKDRANSEKRGSRPRCEGWWDLDHYTEFAASLPRRSFLKLAGASLALAGMVGCRKPIEKIVPYLATPEEAVLGKPNYYATYLPFGLDAFPLLVESHEGRPTKIEGHPTHPAVQGGSNVFMQAAILGLYDPDRSRQVLHRGAVSSWTGFIEFWRGLESNLSATGGKGLAVLSESFNSPTLARLHKSFQERFPQALWATYEPISDENQLTAIKSMTGRDLRPFYHLDQADVVLSLDCDFLHLESECLANARQFTARRQVHSAQDEMNRLYVVECALTLTGAMADHRLAKPSSYIRLLALALARRLLGADLPGAFNRRGDSNLEPAERSWLEALAEDLQNHRGRSLILAGRSQPPEVHALVLLLNEALGNFGKSIAFHPLEHAALPDLGSLKTLTQAAKSGQMTTLIIVGGNPVYDAPVDLDFKKALEGVNNSLHLSPYTDETSKSVHWHLPQTHFLESWGDVCGRGGKLGIIQPLIQPLYNGHSSVEVLHFLATGSDRAGYEIVRETWFKDLLPDRPEERWRETLHDGRLSTAENASVIPQINPDAVVHFVNEAPQQTNPSGLEIVFHPDSKVWDGRFTNNAWLQELPDPLTKMTWDNAAQISPQTAESLGIKSGEVVLLKYRERELSIPVWVQPGVADGSVILSLGYGREVAGSVGNRVGANAYSLRTAGALYFENGLNLVKTGASYKFAITQGFPTQAQRPLIRQATLEHFREHPHFAQEMVETPPLQSLWKEHTYEQGHQWGMVIDLSRCTGCSACVIACQAENNIPVVGKKQILKGREMLWLRVDAYLLNETGPVEMGFQPIPCQHCEMAPCEQVCPVAATVHDPEGLNLMTYNRCVGTRYCSNNCPYKVRRFNYFHFTQNYPETIKMAQNPDVTVRSRGVMEKCTYCLQRLNRAKAAAKLENRTLREGEVMTACQQACPTGAITFGDLLEAESSVAQQKQLAQHYAILAELNTRPRTTYLARLKNPNTGLIT